MYTDRKLTPGQQVELQLSIHTLIYSSFGEGGDLVLPATEHRAWLPEQPVKLRIQVDIDQIFRQIDTDG